MFYLIHRDQSDKNIARKLREEIDEIVGNSEPTYEITKKMKYAEAWYVSFSFVLKTRPVRLCVYFVYVAYKFPRLSALVALPFV